MTYAIVPAGGLGARLGARRPKQYLRLGRAPILVATLRALARTRGLDGIVVAVPEAAVQAGAVNREVPLTGIAEVIQRHG